MRTLPPGSVAAAHASARVARGWVVGFALVLVGCWLATRQGVEVVPEAPIVAGPPTPAGRPTS